MNSTYLQEIDLSEETLAHYGVLGMHWGIRKDPERKGRRSATPKVKKSSRTGSFVRKSTYRTTSTFKNIADMWGDSKGRGEKLVKSGATKENGYFDVKKDTGYLKALLRGSAREIQMGIAMVPAAAAAAALSTKYPLAGAAVSDMIKAAGGVGSAANTLGTIADISNTRDVRKYQKSQRKG